MTTLPVTLSGTENQLPAHLEASVQQARALIAARHSQATRKAYEADLKDFAAWASQNQLTPMPATVESVVLYLTHCSASLKPSSISRKAAAIKYAHRQAGLQSPTDSEPVQATLAGIRRTKGTAPRQAAPATIEVLEKLIEACGDSGYRDKALLAIGFGAALRRSELAGLRLEDLEFTDRGIVINLPRSKTDQEGQGQTVGVLDGQRLKVKERLLQWLQVSSIQEGRIFPVTDRQIANIIKAKAKKSGLDPNLFSGHSLRAGFITSAANSGADVFRVMDVSRHKSVNTVRGYVRRAQLFDGHAGSAFM